MLAHMDKAEESSTYRQAKLKLAVVQNLLEVPGERITDDARAGAAELLETVKMALLRLSPG